MQILHGNFTSAFSLVYCGKFNYEKPSLIMKVSQTSSLWIFLFLGNVHAHGFGSMSHFLTLVGWQVWSSCEVPQGTSGYHHRCLNVDIFINSIWNSHPLCIWYCRILHIFELNTLFWVFEYFFILETSSRRYREQTISTRHSNFCKNFQICYCHIWIQLENEYWPGVPEIIPSLQKLWC